jgi:cytochrome c1
MLSQIGNIENFMPPFASLSDQERWDVVAYALSLSATS